MKKGLVVVDIQNDYFKGGKYELVNPEKAAVQANKMLTYFRKQNLPIFHVCHISSKKDGAFFLPNTIGAEIYKACQPIDGEEIIIKHRPDSFLGTNLKEKLEEYEVDSLVVCGMMTHMCIDTTVRSASAHGYDVELIEDACATRDLEWAGNKVLAEHVQNSYMASLSGNFAKVSKTDGWIAKHK